MPLIAFIIYCLFALCGLWAGTVTHSAKLDNMTIDESRAYFTRKQRNIRVAGELFKAALIVLIVVSVVIAIMS